jgi:membrane protease YdiL (CAAX protease family)
MLAYFFTWTFWAVDYLCVIGKIGINEKAFHVLGVFGPLFASLIVSYRHGGPKAIRSLLQKGIRLKAGIKWYFTVLLIFPVISLLSLFVQNSFIIRLNDFSGFNDIYNMVILFIVMLFFAPLGEEFGWRGFLLDNLQREYKPLKASIIVGLIWAFWHLPFFFIPGKILNQFYMVSKLTLMLFPIYTVGLSLIYTWIYNKTQGSVFLVILLHCMNNWSFEMLNVNNTFMGFNITFGLTTLFGLGLVIVKYSNWDKRRNFGQ